MTDSVERPSPPGREESQEGSRRNAQETLIASVTELLMNERLWEIYEQLCLVEQQGLDEFVRRIKEGEFGEFPANEVIDFLHEIEANMLQNIQVKALEHQAYAEMADEVSEETQKMFEELIEEYHRS